jgi:hypothetical protein
VTPAGMLAGLTAAGYNRNTLAGLTAAGYNGTQE